MIMADDQGDIGYVMLAPAPERLSKIPYIGSRILDGQTSKYDWKGLLPASDYPRSINPSKGYISTANNRQVTDHVSSDLCASSTSTPRAQRINELISDLISSSSPISLEDIKRIQQDDTDVIARDFTPKMLKIADSQSSHLTQKQLDSLNKMQSLLKGWNGRFNQKSIQATAYSYAMLDLHKSLLISQIPSTSEKNRLRIVDNHAFLDYFRKLLSSKPSAEDNQLCYGAYSAYTGQDYCAFNIAMSFVNAYDFLKENLSSNEENWYWTNVHSNEYPNAPWSKSIFKHIFNREVVTAGNMNTVHISKYGLARSAKEMRFVATASPGYKMII